MLESLYYNALARAFSGSRAALLKLRRRFNGWQAAYETLTSKHMPLPNPDQEWKRLEEHGIRLVLKGDASYPAMLGEIADAPFGLYIRGELPREMLALAIVGTRRATPQGRQTAARFARNLSRVGFTIISGLAFGVDGAAHEGVLEEGGAAIAVLATGLDRSYPASHTRLAERIVEKGGALISEYPLGEKAWQYRFLERNRIVSGLSKGVLVIEAPERSGSLVTARLAFEENRDVFVVPGNIDHPNFKGSHALIRQGATLVTAPSEILEAYGLLRDDVPPSLPMNASHEEKLILKALQEISGAVRIDKLVEMTKLEPRILNRTLTFLIFKELVIETESGYTI